MFSIQQYAWLVGSQYKPMELAKSDWGAIKKSPPWAIDSWGMGMLFSVPFNYNALWWIFVMKESLGKLEYYSRLPFHDGKLEY